MGKRGRGRGGKWEGLRMRKREKGYGGKRGKGRVMVGKWGKVRIGIRGRATGEEKGKLGWEKGRKG